MYYFIWIIKDIFYFEHIRYNVCHDFRYFKNQVECSMTDEKFGIFNLSTTEIIGLNNFILGFQTQQNSSKMNATSNFNYYFTEKN